MQSFYVDNCLRTSATEVEAKVLVDKLQKLLAEGCFELRQWASNQPSIISHLPPELQSDSAELWITHGKPDQKEAVLGLHWHCSLGRLYYQLRPVDHAQVTLRTVYKVLASQYDPLGYIVPYTTRAKIIVQQMWASRTDWDDPNLPKDLLQAWNEWEQDYMDVLQFGGLIVMCSQD